MRPRLLERLSPYSGRPKPQQLRATHNRAQAALVLALLLICCPILACARLHLAAPTHSEPSDWPHGYLAICTVVKDQRRELRYWVDYHRWVGVKKLYIFDNNSTRPLAPLLEDYLHEGLVEYTFFAGMPRVGRQFSTTNQAYAYNQCILRHRLRHRFLAFFDVDEFFVLGPEGRPPWTGVAPRPPPDVNAFLAGYDMHGGLALNWILFASSGHLTHPQGGVLINYDKCMGRWHKDSTHVKVIVNTAFVKRIGDTPHQVRLYSGSPLIVTTELVPVRGPQSPKPAAWDKAALYHYVVQSKGDYAVKIKRGSGAGNHKDWEFFLYMDHSSNETCTGGIELGKEFAAQRPPRPAWLRRRVAAPPGPSQGEEPTLPEGATLI